MTPLGRLGCALLVLASACGHKTDERAARARLSSKAVAASSARPSLVTPEEGVLAAVAGVPPEYAEVRKALPLFEACGLTREKALRFLTRLQAAVERSDREAVANLVSYPLSIQGAQPVPDRVAFLRDYDVVMNERVRSAIVEQRPEQLRASGRGAMVGSGELLFRCPDRLLTRSETGSATCDGPNIRVVALDPTRAKSER